LQVSPRGARAAIDNADHWVCPLYLQQTADEVIE
jgi:hypothetical protein